MLAMVYEGPGLPRRRAVSDPTIRDSTDAVVRVDTATLSTHPIPSGSATSRC